VNGDFSAPVQIGVLESDTAAVIDAIIPAGTASGTRYKVKIISSEPEYESLLSNPFVVVLDTQAPTVTITSSESTSTSSDKIDVKITFSEPVTGFVQSDIVLGNAVINSFTSSNAPEYSINISPQASGTVTVDIPADVAYDIAGNWNFEAERWTISYTPTSIADISDFGIKIYPNPTNGQISIELDKLINLVYVSVLDLTGRVMHQSHLSGAGSQKIDLTHLAKGVYIVKISIEGNELTTRLVIK
jgi:hypothetical protein